MAQDLQTEKTDEAQAAHTVNAGRGPTQEAEDHGIGERPPVRQKYFFRGHVIRTVVLLLLLVAAVLGGLWFMGYESSFESTDDAQVDGHIYPISPRISGRVTEVKVDNNYMVTPGQVLVQLDPTDYQVSV